MPPKAFNVIEEQLAKETRAAHSNQLELSADMAKKTQSGIDLPTQHQRYASQLRQKHGNVSP
jgi:hypothetical protein